MVWRLGLGSGSGILLPDTTNRELLEQRLGVPARPAAPTPEPFVMGALPHEDEESWSVRLLDAGPNKLHVMRAVRQFLNLDLMEAKELVDSAPVVVVRDRSRSACLEIAEALKAQGATVELV